MCLCSSTYDGLLREMGKPQQLPRRLHHGSFQRCRQDMLLPRVSFDGRAEWNGAQLFLTQITISVCFVGGDFVASFSLREDRTGVKSRVSGLIDRLYCFVLYCFFFLSSLLAVFALLTLSMILVAIVYFPLRIFYVLQDPGIVNSLREK